MWLGDLLLGNKIKIDCVAVELLFLIGFSQVGITFLHTAKESRPGWRPATNKPVTVLQYWDIGSIKI